MPKTISTARTLARLRSHIAGMRKAGETVALVPTMGALHEGHLALVRLGKRRCDRVVASIFVNPTQFAPNEDFSRYPRDEEGDAAKLVSAGCDLLWAPAPEAMYPDGFATRVVPAGAAEGLEGAFRPHFFTGVATVCCKLFSQVTPDVAVFGEKDFQQLAVIRQMVRDLNLPLKILGLPTVRERDGLAMSSRNRYLAPEERAIAPTLYQVIQAAGRALRAGGRTQTVERQAAKALAQAGFRVDYVAVRDAETLAEVDRLTNRPLRVLAAAWLGKTRLIDNVGVKPSP